ncbi:MAG TPA: M24 family metallopeptidase [Candidatus Polarisedimenticolia bacterium]|nr:M24 family metallopeptidase [Candidatus Polarisedimenticolia bacterium]
MKREAPDIAAIQRALAASSPPFGGWLFYDFRGLDPISLGILRFRSDRMATRRWFYLVPAAGEPVRICHRIEADALDHLPGRTLLYSGWRELTSHLETVLAGLGRVAMQYSPRNAIPYVSRVDGGTLEMVRACGVEVGSSADLVQTFEAVMSEEQLATHLAAASMLRETVDLTFGEVRRRLLHGLPATEFEIQTFMMDRFRSLGFTADHPPIVAVNEHAGQPHYLPEASGSSPIRRGDLLLIDLWARQDRPGSIYADITWTAFLDATVPQRHAQVFEVVRGARDAAASFVQTEIAAGREVLGRQVDDVARRHIEQRGFGPQFTHRTGHNLGYEVHGNGAHLDHLETIDERRLIPRTAFTIEPGVYLPEFGIRSEINLYVREREAIVTGPPIQTELSPLLA